jgi:undecaprenyl-diphosphatase
VTLINILALALLQGFTELLPVSSSAHLILVPAITGWPDQGLMVDAALHLGTFFAILVYFWRDVWGMLAGLGTAVTGQPHNPGARLAMQVVVATIPAVIVGVLIKDYAETSLRSVTLIAGNAIVFGILLFIADRFGARTRQIGEMTWGQALLIGIAQAFALVPGTSRSGITMTAAMGLKYDRVSAARFSFLISLPVTFGAGLLGVYEIVKLGDFGELRDAAWAAGGAFLSSLVAVAFLMKWLRTASFTPFVVYRVLLGAGLLVWVYLFGGPHIIPA